MRARLVGSRRGSYRHHPSTCHKITSSSKACRTKSAAAVPRHSSKYAERSEPDSIPPMTSELGAQHSLTIHAVPEGKNKSAGPLSTAMLVTLCAHRQRSRSCTQQGLLPRPLSSCRPSFMDSACLTGPQPRFFRAHQTKDDGQTASYAPLGGTKEVKVQAQEAVSHIKRFATESQLLCTVPVMSEGKLPFKIERPVAQGPRSRITCNRSCSSRQRYARRAGVHEKG